MPAAILAALARHEADIEAADAGGSRVEHGEAVPVVADGVDRLRELRRLAEDRRAVGAGDSPLPDDDQRMRRRLQRLEEAAGTVGQRLQRLRAGAELLVVVAQVADLADDADRQLALLPALADAGIEHRGLEARIGADDQHRVGLLDAFDGRC